jgi:outer membrane usher protein FimD/PapC
MMRSRTKLSALAAMAVVALALSACSFSTANIQGATLGTGYDSGTILEPTTVFAQEDQQIQLAVNVANAPDDTQVKAVWSIVDVAGHEPTVLYESPLTLNSGENIAHFSLTNDQPWPAGKYKVEIYLNGKLAKTVEYQVEKSAAKMPSIESATLAKGVDQNEPVDPTSVFAPSDLELHLVVKVADAVEGTSLKAVWSVVDVQDYTPEVIDEVPYTLSGGENVADFTLSNDQPWPVGKYKVELYLNDQLVQTLEYEVQ